MENIGKPALTLCVTLRCPYAQRTWIVLEEKGIPYSRRVINLKNKTEVDWYKEHVNPLGKVPAIRDTDGTILYESEIINDTCQDFTRMGWRQCIASPLLAQDCNLRLASPLSFATRGFLQEAFHILSHIPNILCTWGSCECQKQGTPIDVCQFLHKLFVLAKAWAADILSKKQDCGHFTYCIIQ